MWGRDEGMVETVALAAAAEPAVTGGVRVQGPVGVGQPCLGEGTVRVVLPVAEDGMVWDVAGLDVQVTGDDDRTPNYARKLDSAGVLSYQVSAVLSRSASQKWIPSL